MYSPLPLAVKKKFSDEYAMVSCEVSRSTAWRVYTDE